MGVPAESCSKRGIIQHFKRFGRLTNVVCKPRKGFAIVEFETPQVALAAARGGNMMGPSKLKIRRYKARTKPDPSAVASSSATAASGAFPAAAAAAAAAGANAAGSMAPPLPRPATTAQAAVSGATAQPMATQGAAVTANTTFRAGAASGVASELVPAMPDTRCLAWPACRAQHSHHYCKVCRSQDSDHTSANCPHRGQGAESGAVPSPPQPKFRITGMQAAQQSLLGPSAEASGGVVVPAGIPDEDRAAYIAAMGGAPSFVGGKSGGGASGGGAPAATNRDRTPLTTKRRRRPSPPAQSNTPAAPSGVVVPAGIPDEDRAAYIAAMGGAPSFVGGKGGGGGGGFKGKAPVQSQPPATAQPRPAFNAASRKAARAARFQEESAPLDVSAASAAATAGRVPPPPSVAAGRDALRKAAARSRMWAKSPGGAAGLDEFLGECLEMCPARERAERTRWHTLEKFELEHADRPGWTLADMCVTKYARPEAGQNPQVKEKVRPPAILNHVMNYLMVHIADMDSLGPDPRFTATDEAGQPVARVPTPVEIVNYVWDRCRMLRLEYAIQYCKPTRRLFPSFIEVHERLARFLIVTNYELVYDADWVRAAQQNHEQEMVAAVKTLKSLYRYVARSYVLMSGV